MKTVPIQWVLPCLVLWLWTAQADDLVLQLPRPKGPVLELKLSGAPVAGPVEVRVQKTRDFQLWENVGVKRRIAAAEVLDGALLGTDEGQSGFFRLVTRPTRFVSDDGDETLGFAGLFADELDALGSMDVDDFAARYPSGANYLPALTWDPTTAAYWTQLNDPAPTGTPKPFEGGARIPLSPWTLNGAELECFRTNGFVVCSRFASNTMADVYYDVFQRDLPVFVTTDSLLQAWHRSFDAILEDLERGVFVGIVGSLLNDLSAAIPSARAEYGDGWREASLRDADFFLGVAIRLISDPAFPLPYSRLGQEARIDQMVNWILQGQARLTSLMGSPTAEWVDFSLFTPRGHYTKIFTDTGVRLDRYFRAMTWLGRADLRIAGDPHYATPQQLGTAVVLLDLLKRVDGLGSWRALDQSLSVLVGPADSLNFDGLDALLKSVNRQRPPDFATLDDLSNLQQQIESGSLGTQAIGTHGFWGSAGNDQIVLPRSFTFLGQRFVPDSWALGQVVFDRIVTPGSQPPQLVRRRMPYSLDVAFSVLANDQVVPELAANIRRTDGVPFRDGYPYQRNLAAVRNALDHLPIPTWEGTVYNQWLRALRALSQPTTGSEYPEAMRTHAWAMKTLNTQLASWTHLRHDTVLYAKQSVTPPILCSYPAGFVEPRPEFFRRLGELAMATRNQTSVLPATQVVDSKIRPFLSRFASNCVVLERIARAELVQEPLLDQDTAFLENTVEWVYTYFGERKYDGWYPRLFYRGTEGELPSPAPPPARPPDHDSAQPDFIVADVHTDGPSEPDGDPGGVLMEGVGRVNLLVIAVDNGPDRMVYAGPVLSHYEFVQPLSSTRMTDETWSQAVNARSTPAPPPWTGGYLAP